MRWYKHDTDANMDGKLQEVLLDYGLEGYGLYWYCLELIAAKVTAEKLTFDLDHDARIIARNTGSSTEKVQQMMTRFVELRLFENNEGTITCLKIAKRADDYTAKILKSQVADLKQLSDGVGESPTNSDKNKLNPPKVKESKVNKTKLKGKGKPEKFTPIFTNPVCLKTFIKHCHDFSEKPIPMNDPIHKYGDDAKIPEDGIFLCWLEFREKYEPTSKKYQDWRAVFRRCVRDNWYKLWWVNDDGVVSLTSLGKQAKNVHAEKLAA